MAHLRTRLAFFSAASFAVLGVWMPFWPKWLEGRGFSAAEIGKLASAWALARGISSPFFAQWIDRGRGRKFWLIWLSCATFVAFLPLAYATSYAAILFLTILIGALNAPVIHLGEHTVAICAREHGFSFGGLRLYGSLSFVCLSTFCGWFIDHGRSERVLPLLGACFALTIAAALALPPLAGHVRKGGERLPLRDVLANKRLLLVLIGSGCLQASHITYYTYSTLHWTEAGHSTGAVGWLWAEGVFAEVLLFAVSSRWLSRFGSRGLLALGVLAAVLRWAALYASTDLLVLVLVQWLHAFTFAAAHLATMHYVSLRVRPELSGTAHSLYAALNIGVNVAAVMLVAPIFETQRAVAYLPMIGLALAGGVAALIGMKSNAGGRATQDGV